MTGPRGTVAPRGAARRAVRAVLLITAAAGLMACGERDAESAASEATGSGAAASDPATISVTDDAGRTLALPGPARRVLSLIPAQTEAVVLLAGPGVLVARTAWDRDPRLAHLPSIGNALTPSIEWIAARRPDLVIAWPDARSRDVVQKLSDAGIPVYASRVESIADIRAMIRRVGTLLGRDARADSLLHAIHAQLDSVARAAEGRPRPSVLYLVSADPPMVAGPGTYIDELIRLAGGDNVFSDVSQPWPQVSLEEIVTRQPDVIIRPLEEGHARPAADLGGRPGWRAVEAFREGRVHAVDAFLYNRPGPAVGQAAAGLAERIHPDGLRP